MRIDRIGWQVVVLCLLGSTAIGCQTAYYSMWETLGREKRDLLRNNVATIQEEQRDASEQFESALDRLRQLYTIDAAKLEKEYDKLKNSYDRAAKTTGEIQDRIETIKTVAADLFAEWEKELGEISSPELRAKSSQKRWETMSHFDSLLVALKKAEAGMQPVLTQLNDQVLYLKHNLNAAAIGGLGAEISGIEADIDTLVADMNTSIVEADRFLKGLPE